MLGSKLAEVCSFSFRNAGPCHSMKHLRSQVREMSYVATFSARDIGVGRTVTETWI